MNSKLKYSLLFILPVILFITAHVLKVIQGPYYLNFYDPSYVYLINSLNLAQLSGYGVGHFDHPGTTVQVLGAAGVKLFHLLSNNNQDIVNDVLSRPESYLFFINKFFVFLNCTALFFLGYFTLKVTDNFLLAILIQLSPFTSTEIFYGLIIVAPENLLIFCSMFFIASLLYYIFRLNNENPVPVKLILTWGIICGAGLVTKLNFIPVLLIPIFLIRGIKGKFYFLTFTLITFLLLFSPALYNISNFLSWIEKLFINNGRYGNGEATIINESTFLSNIILIYTKDKLYTFAYFFCFVTLITGWYAKRRKSGIEIYAEVRKRSKLLLLIFISMNLQILLVAKHYSQHYIIPSFMLTTFILMLSSINLPDYLRNNFNKIKQDQIILLLIILVSAFSLYKIIFSYNEGNEQRKETEIIVNLVNGKYSDDLVISGFGSANYDCALSFAVLYAADQKENYSKILLGKQRSHIFLNPWGNMIYSPLNKDEVYDIISNSKRIILQITSYGSVEKFMEILETSFGKRNITYKKIITNGNDESLYEIYSD